MSRRRAFIAIMAGGAVAVAAAGSAGCRSRAPDPTAESGTAAPATPAPASAAAMPHGDHNPHHGGVVMMKGELHYEVVLDPSGKAYRLFFTDAVREDLPASVASSAALTVHRPDKTDEVIPLQIDSAGESWIGAGTRVADPAKTTVRVAFTIAREPYWIDLPFVQPPPRGPATK
jgi:hypothetical protein